MSELFWLTKTRNRETTEFCQTLASGIATTLLMELEDSSKATSEYLSATMGKYSQAVIDNNEVVATIGMRATNDPSEETLATFTDILCNAGQINLQSASGVGQMHYNKKFSRMRKQFITSRKALKRSLGPARKELFTCFRN